MSYVGKYAGGSSVSVSYSAGDTLVALVTAERVDVLAVSAPAGWVQHGSAQWLGSWWYVKYWAAAVWTWRAPADGTNRVVSFSLGDVDAHRTTILRYSGAKEVRGSAYARIQHARPSWPAIAESGSGDVVHVLLADDAATPTGDALRYSGIALAADRAVSSVASIAAATSTGAITDGHAWTLFLAATLRVPTPVLTEIGPSVDTMAEFELSWAPVPGQTSFSVQRATNGGSVEYWTGSAWQGTQAWVTSSASSVAYSEWAYGASYEIAVTVRIGTDASAVSAPLVIRGVQAPAAPSITLSSTVVRTPTVTVTGSAGSGATLTGYSITVRNSAGVITFQTVDADGVRAVTMPDGAITIEAYVLQDSGTQSGPTATLAATMVVPPAASPVVSVSTASHPVSGLPGVALAVTTSLPGTVPLEVRVDGVLRFSDEISAAKTVYDWSPGALYEVRVIASDGESSLWVSAAAGVVPHEWLTDPLAPELAVHAHLVEDPATSVDLRATASALLDRSAYAVGAGVAIGRTGRLVLGTDAAGADKVADILSRGRPVVYHLPTATHEAGMTSTPVRLRAVGVLTIERTGHTVDGDRHVAFDYVTA